ncbi:MAG: 4-hydroxyphenylacetate 3-monooxygenase [Bacillus sp. (in: Bacteria)]|nr:4-hydroxyphenylacetate 3-monooxygenase [Bacillus sp. (in: firmicutes)]
MGLINGKNYIDRIDKMGNEVWIQGERVSGKLSEHPAFQGILKTKAALYDMQFEKDFEGILTDTSLSGEQINFAYHQTKSVADLVNRREATQLWARKSCGTVGRSPDYINTAIMTLGAATTFFQESYGKNVSAMYEYAIRNDLSFTHTFINPQMNRSPGYWQYDFFQEMTKGDIVAARVVDEGPDGIVVHGARLLATQGGITDEVLVLPTGAAAADPSYAYAFAIPSNTKGLKFLCREPYAPSVANHFDHPLTAQFDEVDAVVVFDEVVVPWERVFIYKDPDRAAAVYSDTNLNMMLLFQAAARQVVKTEYLLGIGEAVAESIGIKGYQHVQEKLSEIIVTLEVMKSLIYRGENKAFMNDFGLMVPEKIPLMVASNYFQKGYGRLVEVLHLLGASGFISLPTEQDFQSAVGKDLEQYLQGRGAGAKERVALFRLAWDLTMSPFGSRQTQYERFFLR